MEEFYNVADTAFQLPQPFRLLVAGPSSCGKSELIRECVTDSSLVARTDHARYYCPENTLTSSRLQYVEKIRTGGLRHLEAFEGLPDVSELQSLEGSKLIIIDDMFYNFVNSSEMNDLMVVHSHHADVSVVVTAQNYFSKGKYANTMKRNMTDLILFDSKPDRLPFETVSRQLFPGEIRFLPKIMDWLRANITMSFGRYIYIDCHPSSQLPEELRVRTNIVKRDSFPQVVFTPKK